MLRRLTPLLLLCPPLAAQQDPPLPEYERGFDFGVSLDARGEHRDAFDMATGGDGDSGFLGRLTAYGRYKWGKQADFVAEGIGAYDSFLDDENDEVDLLRGYAHLHGLWSDRYGLRAGRLGFEFGSGRFFGGNDYQYVPDAWDGIAVEGESFPWHVFWAQSALGSVDFTEQTLVGAWFTWPIYERTRADFAFVQLDQDDIFRKEWNIILEFSHESRGGSKWDAFFVHQDGQDTGFRSLYAQAFALRFTQELDLGNTFWTEFAFARGDGDPLDDESNTYTPTLIDFHSYNGRADIVAFSNLMDFSVGWRKRWSERWSLVFDGHLFWRQNTDDVIYLGINADPVPTPSTSSVIGQEIDLMLETQWSPGFSTEIGGAYFFTGSSFSHTDDQLFAVVRVTLDF